MVGGSALGRVRRGHVRRARRTRSSRPRFVVTLAVVLARQRAREPAPRVRLRRFAAGLRVEAHGARQRIACARMKGRTAAAIATLALTALLALPAAAPAHKHFRAYAVVPLAAGKHADRFCFEGDHRSPSCARSTRRRSDTGSASAGRASASTAAIATRERGASSHAPRFDVDGAGKYKLAWFANGRSSIATSS